MKVDENEIFRTEHKLLFLLLKELKAISDLLKAPTLKENGVTHTVRPVEIEKPLESLTRGELLKMVNQLEDKPKNAIKMTKKELLDFLELRR